MEFTLFGLMMGSFILALSGALMPGPLLTLTIAESTKRGFAAGPLLILGHGILELAFIIALIMGGESYLGSPLIRDTISMVGGGVLLWMGFAMVLQGRRINPSSDHYSPPEDNLSRGLNPVLGGILVSLSNPYWFIWWLTIGLGYMVMAMEFGLKGIAVFFIGHIMADLAWYSMVSYGVSRGKAFLKQRTYSHVIVFCGFFLLFFGLWFFYLGTRSIV